MSGDSAANSAGGKKEVFDIPARQELRLDFKNDEIGELVLLSGNAEILGSHLTEKTVYRFKERKIAVFTWEGCRIELRGASNWAYIAEETPMVSYANLHVLLNQTRDKAAQSKQQRGPVVFVCGPTDSGKSSLCQMLCSYAANEGNTTMFVDLDIGQGQITVPGSLAMTCVEEPISIEDQLSISAVPLAFYYGHPSPSNNKQLYTRYVERLAQCLKSAQSKYDNIRKGGAIVNTMGWVEGLGYELLVKSMELFEVSHVVVLGDDRLFSTLSREINKFEKGKPELLKLSRSGGAVQRTPEVRSYLRSSRVREYFYGPSTREIQLCPNSLTVKFADIDLVKIGTEFQAPVDALPIGFAPALDPCELLDVTPSKALTGVLCGVAATHEKDKVVDSNVQGFVVISEVDVEKKQLILLTPVPEALPTRLLIVGTVLWNDM